MLKKLRNYLNGGRNFNQKVFEKINLDSKARYQKFDFFKVGEIYEHMSSLGPNCAHLQMLMKTIRNCIVAPESWKAISQENCRPRLP